VNTKLLMTASAIVLFAVGIILIFIPEEILTYFNLEITISLRLFIQILGSLYFGFGMLNWMSKTSIIGGIYNKPVVAANLAHFMIAALVLIKGILSNTGLSVLILIITLIYTVFAISFMILFSATLLQRICSKK
jgi:hypothetical protein